MRLKDGSGASREDSELQGAGRLSWNLDWNLLRTFLVIAEKNSITGAAIELGLKQPTVSNSLKRLELVLDTPLAERDPRNFVLTRQGKALYRECLDIFGSVSRLPDLLASLSNTVEGHLKICMASHITTPLLDNTLAEFHRENPRTSFSVSIMSSHEVQEAVLAKTASFGVCLALPARTDIQSQLFYREHFGFFCGPGHPLYGRKKLNLEDLRGHERVTFFSDEPGDVLNPVAALRAQAGFSDRVAGASNNLEEVRRMIGAGLGFGPLPIHVVERDIESGRLWQLPPYRHTPAVDITLLSNSRANLNVAEATFLRKLTTLIANTPLAQRTYGNITPKRPSIK
ncbi:LysR family transcriptional regulator [Haliea sp. E1-2-M8]|uniref:LysR family transcriptional regulator n=1 Tax=Haliea sp. E1-2-M8 TaxID=3064706 RepID=UPI002726BFC1|nr:LysR family transcriptional regulator [Haliea sp. E1-2-M8]MDO8861182.1 LysR family transcriptional regulator [Haliea sp. E1-2-M8]